MSALPQPWRDIRDVIKEIREDVRRLKNRPTFFGTGMHANGQGGIDSDNYQPGVSGYSFGADGEAEFNTLILRAGSVSSSALSSPYVPGVAGTETSNFAVGTTAAEVAGVDLTVPEGCTRLAITITGHVYAENPTETPDALWASVRVGDTAATPLGAPLDASSLATASSSLAASLGNLEPLSTVHLSVWAAVSVNTLTASAANTAAITANLTWRP